ncbi:ATP-binding protein [Anaerosolibacter sp.]|uniref:ATP-binding protein n=1 Tax=Anaerosolibacter sp. TaxID=1872527 RepID=UPI0039EF6668
MKIKGLRIGRFGKLKDLEIQLGDGLNIIYGENEAGKTTLQTFMKAMFYGLGSMKKEIRDNERKRFLPWSGDDAAGELLFQDDSGKEFLIKRSFGEKRKKDDTLILDPVSGAEIGFVDRNQPGQSFFGMGEEAFEKTVFIKQLHSQVERDREDEIMKRLTNLHQTGDEDTSYHKAMGALQLARKGLIGQRKMGKLDELKAAQERLKDDLKVAKDLQEENICDQMIMNQIQEQKIILHHEIMDLEKKKKEIRQLEQKQEYLELCNYADRVKALTLAWEEKQRAMKIGDREMDESHILDLRDQFRQWKELKRQGVESIELTRMIKAEHEEKMAYLQRFKNHDHIEEDMELKLTRMMQEQEHLEDRLRAWNRTIDEIHDLENQLENERNNLGVLRKFEDVTPDIEVSIYHKEEQLKELKEKLSGDQRRDHLQFKREILSSQRKNSIFLLAVGILALVIGIAGGLGLTPSFYVAGGIGVLLSIYGVSSKKKSEKELSAIEEEISAIGDSQSIEKAMEDIRKELGAIYYQLGVMGLQEFRTYMSRYNEKKNQMEGLRIRIEDRQENMNGEKAQELREQLKILKGSIQRIFAQWDCDSLETFQDSFKNYKQILSEKDRVEKELKDLGEKIGQLDVQREELGKGLRQQLNLMTLDETAVENSIARLAGGLKEISDLERDKDSLENTFNSLLKGRVFETIQDEVGTFEEISAAEELESQELLEKKLKEQHQQLIELEKQIKDIGYRIHQRFAQSRSVSVIEEEIGIVETQILELEEVAAAIDCSMEVLEDSFHEIQRSFGPRLNKSVGEILGKITRGKYEDLMISEGYHVKVIDPVEDKIKEIDYFSNGTWDQIYFAMRMGITQLIFDGSSIPVIMDDAFVQYDEGRLEAVLNYLYAYGKTHQVILFTCQKRELEFLRNYENVNYIYLN